MTIIRTCLRSPKEEKGCCSHHQADSSASHLQ
jgi:hypothetical protein